jgi:hypothetical protein
MFVRAMVVALALPLAALLLAAPAPVQATCGLDDCANKSLVTCSLQDCLTSTSMYVRVESGHERERVRAACMHPAAA